LFGFWQSALERVQTSLILTELHTLLSIGKVSNKHDLAGFKYPAFFMPFIGYSKTVKQLLYNSLKAV
jgi:hypothetical protein